MANELLNDAAYIKILQDRLKTTKFKVITADLKPISENSEGFLGEHYKLKITYKLDNSKKEEVEQFFLKTKPTKNQVQIEAAQQTGVYGKEIFFYDFLLREFKKLGYDTSFAAYCYHCVPDQTLVLDDITLTGFELAERGKPYSMRQIKELLRALALYHGAGFAYEQEQKKIKKDFSLAVEYESVLKECFYDIDWKSDSFAMDWWKQTFAAIDKLTELLPESEEYKKKFRQLIKDRNFGDIFKNPVSLPRTLGHGDLWSNNMMLKFSSKLVTKCCLLDFQLVRYFYPAFDMLLAIFFNTDAKFRAQHLAHLYQFYYDTLDQIVHTYGYAIAELMPLEDFNASIKLTKYEALVQVISGNTFIFLPAETLTGFVKEGGDALRDALFNKKEEMAAAAFLKDEKYRNIVLEGMKDLYNVLIEGK